MQPKTSTTIHSITKSDLIKIDKIFVERLAHIEDYLHLFQFLEPYNYSQILETTRQIRNLPLQEKDVIKLDLPEFADPCFLFLGGGFHPFLQRCPPILFPILDFPLGYFEEVTDYLRFSKAQREEIFSHSFYVPKDSEVRYLGREEDYEGHSVIFHLADCERGRSYEIVDSVDWKFLLRQDSGGDFFIEVEEADVTTDGNKISFSPEKNKEEIISLMQGLSDEDYRNVMRHLHSDMIF